MTRLRGLKRQVRMDRWLIIALVVVVAVSSVGITYAKMQGGPQNKGVVPCCCDPFTWVVSNDDGTEDNVNPYGIIDPGDDGGGTDYDKWDSQSSDDPSEPQTMGVECDRYNKDVAKTTAWMSEDRLEITVLVENAYPSYYPTVFFALMCPDSASGTITDIVVDNQYPDVLTISTSGIYKGQPIPQDEEVTGAVHVHVEQAAAQNAVYTFNVTITTECQPAVTCGTAYAYHADYATCFLNLGFTKWGWTNGPLVPGSYEFQFWAGAADCDTSKPTARLVGQVTVNYDGSTAVVNYQLYEGNWMTDTHLYVGNNRLPRDKKGDETVNPGQYPYKHESLNNVATDSYTVTGLSGNIYIVAHALVCWYE